MEDATEPALLSAMRSWERLTGKQLDSPYLDTSTNFGPVAEEITAEDLELVEGALPSGFPDGLYVRNGPNPRFAPDCVEAPLLGRSAHHWFEGDGMLHAVHFKGGQCSYRNRYVRTSDFLREEAAGKALWRPLADTSSVAALLNPVGNVATLGSANKNYANTSVIYHGGRLLALVEGACMPTEIQPDDLSTVGTFQFGREEAIPSFTAHPKVDPVTGEMVFAAYHSEPFVHAGVVGPDGNLKHWTPIESAERNTMMHDCAITERYTLLLDFPLTIDVGRVFRGEKPVDFEEGPSRIGVMPRFGEDCLRWFEFAPGVGFHIINAYEDGDEVVLRGCRSASFQITLPWSGGELDREGFIDEYFQEGSPYLIRLHEWRMNMRDGSCSEHDLGEERFADLPTVSPKVVGRPHTYCYCASMSREMSVPAGFSVTGSVIKYSLGRAAGEAVGVEEHVYGEGVSGGEAVFVPRPGAAEEDDGWLLVFTYDLRSQSSELRIIDGRNFSGPPCCRIKLPQRVPYGYHGTFVPA